MQAGLLGDISTNPRLHRDFSQIRVRDAPWVIQARHAVNPAGDLYEEEADRIADRVVRMAKPAPSSANLLEDAQRQPGSAEISPLPVIQRNSRGESYEHPSPYCLQPEPYKCEDRGCRQFRRARELREPGSMKGCQCVPIGRPASTEEMLQTETSGKAFEVASRFESEIENLRGGGQPLSTSVRAFFEPRFGYDFGRVRVHTDSKAAESARAINAFAYTVGSDTFFSAGRYAPDTEQGKRLLAHELTHVVQQGAATSKLQMREIMTHGVPFGTVQLHRDCTPSITGVDNADEMINSAKSAASSIMTRITGAFNVLAQERALAQTGGGQLAERAALNRAFSNPNAQQVTRIQEVYNSIAGWLPGADFICSPAREEDCVDRNGRPAAAFVQCPPSPSDRVHLCPNFFQLFDNPRGMRLIHEGAHCAGVCPIGSEFYFEDGGTPPENAADVCADSYSHFDDFLVGERERQRSLETPERQVRPRSH